MLATPRPRLPGSHFSTLGESRLERGLEADPESIDVSAAGPALPITVHHLAPGKWWLSDAKRRDVCACCLCPAPEGEHLEVLHVRAPWTCLGCLERIERVAGLLNAALRMGPRKCIETVGYTTNDDYRDRVDSEREHADEMRRDMARDYERGVG